MKIYKYISSTLIVISLVFAVFFTYYSREELYGFKSLFFEFGEGCYLLCYFLLLVNIPIVILQKRKNKINMFFSSINLILLTLFLFYRSFDWIFDWNHKNFARTDGFEKWKI